MVFHGDLFDGDHFHMSIAESYIERSLEYRESIVVFRHHAAVVHRNRKSSGRTGRVCVIRTLSGAFTVITGLCRLFDS